MKIKRYLLSGATAVVCAGALAFAQSPAEKSNETQDPVSTRESTTQQAIPEQDASMTVTGCLYRASEMPGRQASQANTAERAGAPDGYILGASSSAAPQPGGTAGATGTSGAEADMASVYKVELISDATLQDLIGKRVEVKGRVDTQASMPVGTSGSLSAPGATAGATSGTTPSGEIGSSSRTTGSAAGTTASATGTTDSSSAAAGASSEAATSSSGSVAAHGAQNGGAADATVTSFQAASIREVSGDCARQPAGH